MTIQDWIAKNRLQATFSSERLFNIPEFGDFIVIEAKGGKIFNEELELILDEEDKLLLGDENVNIEYFTFEFGNSWYYSKDESVADFKLLQYLGKEQDVFEDAPPSLAIHGGYDICNGSRDYKDWCSKAIFCNINTLGIAEENTLAGTLAFQNACEKAKIHSVIGETVTVKDNGNSYTVKLYVINETGWKNLLLINAQINVFNQERYVSEEFLFKHAKGLNCVLTGDVNLDAKVMKFVARFDDVFYQFDISQYDSDDKDKRHLIATKYYLDHFYPAIKPALILDAYYLEADHANIRKDLNSIGGVSFKNQSKDQFFKTPNEVLTQILSLFAEMEKFGDVVNSAINGTKLIASSQFKIETGKLHLPKYILTEEEQKLGDNKDLFWHLIQKGIADLKLEEKENIEEYLDRIEKEAKVILDANLQDYFLIIWDILNWSQKQGIKTGYGRGSAAGCLIAYLLGIVQTDPLEYDLLFERFLNEGRLYKKKKVRGYKCYHAESDVNWEQIEQPTQEDAEQGVEWEESEIEVKVTGSMPDIDNDIAGERREEVKRYIEQKYGKNRVASIGTYGTFQIKGGIQAFTRRMGGDVNMARYVTGALPKTEAEDLTFGQLFETAQKIPIVKEFVQDNYELVEKLPLVLGQAVNSSTHAAGVIIVPESENGIFDQLPVKLDKDGIVVSEWEMGYVEQAGFLKMDILGLKQLDKFTEIIDLIKQDYGDEIELKDIPLDDSEVYEYFSKGLNEDVFQFGGGGLKSYTQQLKPENIDDLIATVALYRPGPIETQAHMKYVHMKNGVDEPTFPYGTEEILESTYGNIVYQEQVMKIVQSLAGFTLNEADDVRKAMGKKDAKLMKTLKERFVEGASKNGAPETEAAWLWDQMEVFAGYAFNKSHATCYAITGYHCQWLKVNYPIQFWTVALKYTTKEQLPARLSEIYSTSAIKLAPPDINKSEKDYVASAKHKVIYWTISSIKQVGPAAVEAILEERKVNGLFYGIEDFAKRMKAYSKSVKKNTIINLILAGAFDEHYNLDSEKQRFDILSDYLKFIGQLMPDDLMQMKVWKQHQWIMKQKELSGLGSINFKKVVQQTNLSAKINRYLTNEAVLEANAEELPDEIVVAGTITKALIKGDRPFMIVEISDGLHLLNGVIWSDTYLIYKDKLKDPINKLIIVSCSVRYDSTYRRVNTFYTSAKSTMLVID